MEKKRQDAWTSDEDIVLAEIVLRHIRHGKTQLEAFKEAGAKLSRTAAACGFRWNATLRKKYVEGVEIAKRNKKKEQQTEYVVNGKGEENSSLDQAILLLKKLKDNSDKHSFHVNERTELERLKEENKRLSEIIKHYEAALTEIHNIWNWARNKNEHFN